MWSAATCSHAWGELRGPEDHGNHRDSGRVPPPAPTGVVALRISEPASGKSWGSWPSQWETVVDINLETLRSVWRYRNGARILGIPNSAYCV